MKKIPPHQLLSLLPAEEMEAIVEQSGVDRQVKHLFGPLLVKLFLLAILEDKDHSLQSLVDLYNNSRFSYFSGKGAHQTAKSSLSDRLAKIKLSYVEQLYDAYLAALKRRYGKRLEKKYGWLTRFDSTMLALCASLTQIGMRVGAKRKKGSGKVQIKVTLGLQGLWPSSVHIHHQQKMLSEEHALKHAVESQQAESQGIIVFDMGLKKRQTFKSWAEEGRLFITRLKNPRYVVVREHSRIKGRQHEQLRLLSDQIVYLYSSGTCDSLVQQELRLITATCEEGPQKGKTFYFLTSILDLPAGQICDLYRRRWDIEVFFRFIKQEVDLRHLLATQENGIKAVIYLRLLVGTMIWAYAHLNQRKDFKRCKTEFANELDEQIWEVKAAILLEQHLIKRPLMGPDFQTLAPFSSA